MSSPQLKYVLITPARNEEAFIEGTIRSMVVQTVRPLRWIIVSDGSTDRTDEIVKRYAAEHEWIELLRMPERRDRQFAAKANAFNAGYEKLKPLTFDLIGNLDADITLPSDYYEFLLSKFNERPKLGVAGTPFVEDSTQPDKHTYAHGAANLEHVSGACQIFRRKCFEEVGGYVPIKGGAIDWIAVTTARMKGWETRTFTERVCFHRHRQSQSTASEISLRSQGLLRRRSSCLGSPTRRIPDASETVDCRRNVFHQRVSLGRRHAHASPGFARTHEIPSL